MFKSISIHNFRGFTDFQIDSLERVNLIAGANDVGKTALLEAICLLSGQTHIELLGKLQGFRGLGKYEGDVEAVADWLWRGFFHKLDPTDSIRISGSWEDGREHRIEIRMVPSPSARVSLGGTSGYRAYSETLGVAEGPAPETVFTEQPEGQRAETFGQLPSKALELSYVDPSGASHVYRMIVDMQGVRVEPSPLPPSFPGFLLPARVRTSPEEDARNFGRLKVKKERYNLLDVLTVVEPRLRQIEPYSGPGGATLYGDIGLSEMLPLGLLGDGLSRLTSIILKIANAHQGLVLVDEVDNGLHHSVIEKVWAAIGAAARLFDVQIFATTHSWECIQAAHRAFEASGRYDLRLYRLDRLEDGIRAVAYDQESLATSVEMNLEVR